MKAICWHGRQDMRVDNVDDPKILDAGDVIIKVTSTAICGSDLHLYNGYMPSMEAGDVVGHEPMGVVMEVGNAVTKLSKGDRVVVPFTLSCGHCFFCERLEYSLCDESNPNADMAAKVMGHSPAGLFGFSHMLGGFAGGQAEYLRVPYADVGPIKIPDGIPDDQVLFLSDIFPTGYMAAENCGIEQGDTVAVWGCGPVAQFAIQSAWMLGAGRVVAIDREPERLEMARTHGKAETIHFEQENVYERLMEMTQGRGPDRCIDAVGAEAHAAGGVREVIDDAKEAVHVPANHPYVLAEAIKCCRKGGTISIPGVYTSTLNGVPMGPAMNKALTFKMGQTHVQRYLKPLLQKIVEGAIDPSFVITHRGSLDQAPELYKTFEQRSDKCIKVVLNP
ncbi:zinc-dependent alcohol dehydrogenase [Allorhodopirellula heiligendammensis]|uniref:Glutathione-independent formaldehyde dehydrogenase n=1 Tax=Allorhodopirellula heiligendammensis TaxID=2714739 RepID=A0A5C6BGK3_9BACT|nr:zinc-dependent alcohol dehydrogenase [Allorhodopirellula heiligendammensis]TWU10399.1 Glutathione-independent formaldehyde dehydrogenase [Allorhodopirellula heiligendammensis]